MSDSKPDWVVWLDRARMVLTVLLAVWFVWWLGRIAPPEHVPWRELDPNAPIGTATKAQLLRVSLAPSETCAELADAMEGLDSVPAEPRDGGEICGWEVARLVSAMESVELAGESSMQCPLSLGVGLWLREVDALARERLGSGVARVHHFGTYSCRRMYGRSSGRWSEHAFANAWDVASFDLWDGRNVSVLRDWGSGEKGRFLEDARDAACRVFRVTLSPDYNAAHADHFHLDMGPNSTCR